MSDTSSTLDARMPSRRTVVRTAAWATPAVMVASSMPAYAASPTTRCVPAAGALLQWDAAGWTRSADQATFTQVATAPGASESVTVEVTAAYFGGRMAMGDARTSAPQQEDFDPNANFKFSPITTGTTPEQSLILAQHRKLNSAVSGATRVHYGLYTFRFGRPVTNVSFRVADIDAGAHPDGNDYSDAFLIQALGAGPGVTTDFTVSGRGERVTGAGTGIVGGGGESNFDPFRYATFERIESTDTRGHVTLSHAGGPISGFAIQYWNSVQDAEALRSNQTIKIGRIGFDYEVCTPAR